MSDHRSCVQYLLLCLLIFRLFEIENLFGISIQPRSQGSLAENLPNSCLRFSFSPTKSLAASTRVRASVLSLWTCNIMRWFCLESPALERKYVFTRFKAENDFSLTVLVAGMASDSFPRVEISLNTSFLRELFIKGLQEGYQIIYVKFWSVKPHWLCCLW